MLHPPLRTVPNLELALEPLNRQAQKTTLKIPKLPNPPQRQILPPIPHLPLHVPKTIPLQTCHPALTPVPELHHRPPRQLKQNSQDLTRRSATTGQGMESVTGVIGDIDEIGEFYQFVEAGARVL